MFAERKKRQRTAALQKLRHPLAFLECGCPLPLSLKRYDNRKLQFHASISDLRLASPPATVSR